MTRGRIAAVAVLLSATAVFGQADVTGPMVAGDEGTGKISGGTAPAPVPCSNSFVFSDGCNSMYLGGM